MMPHRPEFDPDDDEDYYGVPGRRSIFFGSEQVYGKFKAVLILQFVTCFVCLSIIIFCVIYVLNKKKINEFRRRQFQIELNEQREIELGVKKMPHIPQANKPLPQASIFAEQALENEQSFEVLKQSNGQSNSSENSKWTIDDISDMSSD